MAERSFPPSWLTNEFLEDVLRSALKDDSVNVTKSETLNMSEMHNQRTSVLYKVKVRIQRTIGEQKLFLVVKTVPPSDLELLKELKFFDREIQMYKTILPQANRVVEEFSSGSCKQISPKLYFAHLDCPAPVIIMEDLAEIGFRSMYREDASNVELCQAVAKAIAWYHIGTMASSQRAPQLLDVLSENLYNSELKKMLQPFFYGVSKSVADEMGPSTVYNTESSSKLEEIPENVMEIIEKAMDCNDKIPKVLIHGNLQLTNTMIRASKGGYDVRFVDYQMSCYTSPVIDVIRFIFSVPNEELIIFPRVLVKEYYTTLKETADLLQIPYEPIYYDFVEEIYSRSSFCTVMATTILPITLGDVKTALDGLELMVESGDTSNKSPIHLTNIYKEIFKKWLEKFSSKNWL